MTFYKALKKNCSLYFTAPGTYCPEKVQLDKAPQFSFGVRPPLEKLDDIPGGKNFFNNKYL